MLCGFGAANIAHVSLSRVIRDLLRIEWTIVRYSKVKARAWEVEGGFRVGAKTCPQSLELAVGTKRDSMRTLLSQPCCAGEAGDEADAIEILPQKHCLQDCTTGERPLCLPRSVRRRAHPSRRVVRNMPQDAVGPFVDVAASPPAPECLHHLSHASQGSHRIGPSECFRSKKPSPPSSGSRPA
jgi:hypothetical protein